MGAGYHGGFGNTKGNVTNNYVKPKKSFINIQLFAINKEKQARHNEGNTLGKSILFGGEKTAQEIVDKYGGTGRKINFYKECVKCDKIVGLYRENDGSYSETFYAIIVKSKTGDHVYPANPNQYHKEEK